MLIICNKKQKTKPLNQNPIDQLDNEDDEENYFDFDDVEEFCSVFET